VPAHQRKAVLPALAHKGTLRVNPFCGISVFDEFFFLQLSTSSSLAGSGFNIAVLSAKWSAREFKLCFIF